MLNSKFLRKQLIYTQTTPLRVLSLTHCMHHDISCSHNGVAKDSSPLGRDAVSLGEWIPTFKTITVLSPSWLSSPVHLNFFTMKSKAL